MKLIKKKFIYTIVGSLLLMIFPVVSSADEEENFSVPANAALAVDYETGKILYSQNAETPLGIASMTKLLSAYLVYEAVEAGTITWDQEVPFDDELIKTTQDPTFSNIPINKKLTYTVADNLEAMLISSANASTTALARLIAGSEQNFVDMMTEKVENWGIHDSKFISASGLAAEDALKKDRYPGSIDEEENMLSAIDMVTVATHLLNDYPEVLDITKKPSFTLFEGSKNEETYYSSNLLLPEMPYATTGVDGLKTGTTVLAGYSFIGTIVDNDRRIITVVMGVDEDYNRFLVTKDLMDYALNNWTYEAVLEKGDSAITPSLDVTKGTEDIVNLVIAEDVMMWSNTQSEVQRTISADLPESLIAPITSNEVVGTETIVDDFDDLGYLVDGEIINKHQETSVSIITEDEVAKAPFYVNIWRSIINLFS